MNRFDPVLQNLRHHFGGNKSVDIPTNTAAELHLTLFVFYALTRPSALLFFFFFFFLFFCVCVYFLYDSIIK